MKITNLSLDTDERNGFFIGPVTFGLSVAAHSNCSQWPTF
jgi:hypothetical protein